jgi:hypothetical protein
MTSPDPALEKTAGFATLKMRDLNSVDVAECTRLTQEILGSHWQLDEIDDDDEHHLSWELVTVGAAIVQCALARDLGSVARQWKAQEI